MRLSSRSFILFYFEVGGGRFVRHVFRNQILRLIQTKMFYLRYALFTFFLMYDLSSRFVMCRKYYFMHRSTKSL